MYSWGNDAPPEAYWVLNSIVKFINEEYGSNLEPIPESEDGPDDVLFNEIEKTIRELSDG
jgi:hypothetical protein